MKTSEVARMGDRKMLIFGLNTLAAHVIKKGAVSNPVPANHD